MVFGLSGKRNYEKSPPAWRGGDCAEDGLLHGVLPMLQAERLWGRLGATLVLFLAVLGVFRANVARNPPYDPSTCNIGTIRCKVHLFPGPAAHYPLQSAPLPGSGSSPSAAKCTPSRVRQLTIRCKVHLFRGTAAVAAGLQVRP